MGLQAQNSPTHPQKALWPLHCRKAAAAAQTCWRWPLYGRACGSTLHHSRSTQKVHAPGPPHPPTPAVVCQRPPDSAGSAAQYWTVCAALTGANPWAHRLLRFQGHALQSRKLQLSADSPAPQCTALPTLGLAHTPWALVRRSSRRLCCCGVVQCLPGDLAADRPTQGQAGTHPPAPHGLRRPRSALTWHLDATGSCSGSQQQRTMLP